MPLRLLNQLALLMPSLRECDKDSEWSIALEFRHVFLYCGQVVEAREIYCSLTVKFNPNNDRLLK